MKRLLAIFLAITLAAGMLAGCCMRHEWMRADCESPKTCLRCGKTEGEPLGHIWQEGDCTHARRCEVCGVEQGEAPGHSWLEADCVEPRRCQVCDAREGKPLGHRVDSGTISGETITGTCGICGLEADAVIDWAVFPQALMEGRWEGMLLTDGENTVDAPEGTYLEMYADGTCLTVLAGEEYGGNWRFDYHDTTDENPCLWYRAVLDGDDFRILIFDSDLTHLYLSRDGIIVIYQK